MTQAMELSLDAVDVLELATRHQEGTGPLFSGHLESVASLYQVHPDRLERARHALSEPAIRRAAVESVGQRLPHRDPRPHEQLPCTDVPSLIVAAMSQLHGMDVLTQAPMEMAAVRFGAHPFLVEEARAQLASTFVRFPRMTHPGDRAS